MDAVAGEVALGHEVVRAGPGTRVAHAVQDLGETGRPGFRGERGDAETLRRARHLVLVPPAVEHAQRRAHDVEALPLPGREPHDDGVLVGRRQIRHALERRARGRGVHRRIAHHLERELHVGRRERPPVGELHAAAQAVRDRAAVVADLPRRRERGRHVRGVVRVDVEKALEHVRGDRRILVAFDVGVERPWDRQRPIDEPVALRPRLRDHGERGAGRCALDVVHALGPAAPADGLDVARCPGHGRGARLRGRRCRRFGLVRRPGPGGPGRRAECRDENHETRRLRCVHRRPPPASWGRRGTRRAGVARPGGSTRWPGPLAHLGGSLRELRSRSTGRVRSPPQDLATEPPFPLRRKRERRRGAVIGPRAPVSVAVPQCPRCPPW